MVFKCIIIRQVPREILKTAASGFGFQHLPRDLMNVNAWKTMFDPYITYRASMGLGNQSLFVGSGSLDDDVHHANIW